MRAQSWPYLSKFHLEVTKLVSRARLVTHSWDWRDPEQHTQVTMSIYASQLPVLMNGLTCRPKYFWKGLVACASTKIRAVHECGGINLSDNSQISIVRLTNSAWVHNHSSVKPTLQALRCHYKILWVKVIDRQKNRRKSSVRGKTVSRSAQRHSRLVTLLK